ncbi:hypothetical protein EE612_009959 [Oryza sativa]|nr:hypothetical protein EE612_009959 [Oryza sativa]
MANDSLATGRVIGDVLDPFISTVDLTVMYGDDGMPVISGVELRAPAVAEKPVVEVGGDDLRVAYTLVMVDPDAPNPSNPTLREYLHWMVTDIPASTDATYGRWCATRARTRRWGSTGWCWCCSGSWGGRRCTRRRCATTSPPAPSPAATTSARPSPPSTSTASARPAPAAGGSPDLTPPAAAKPN